MGEHVEFWTFNVAEHAVCGRPQEQAEEAEARQEIIHHRRDRKRPPRLSAKNMNQLNKLTRESISARNENQHCQQQRNPNLQLVRMFWLFHLH